MIDVISLALSKNYTDKKITKAATSLSFKQKIVESLPSSGEIHTIYFIKNNSSWKDNYYDEYLWIPDTNSFEKIGSTEIPATLPNPNALIFTGAINASYDGSSEVSVEIPDAYGATETVIFSLDSVEFTDDGDGTRSASIDMPMPFTEAGIYRVKIGNRSGITGISQKDIDDWNDNYKESGEYIDIDLWDIFRDEKNLNESFPDGLYYNNTTLTLYDNSIEAGEYPVSITKVDVYPSIKMDKVNPTAIGSFSLNRKPGSAIGNYSHAEGQLTTASGTASHAEGANTTASASCSHAEGSNTTASGPAAHAEGYITTASGRNSHAEGQVTTAKSENQHVQGKYNIEDSSGVYADIIGNGIASKRSNAATVDWSGNAWYAGDVYVGSTSGTNKDSGSKKLATEEYVNNSVPDIPTPTQNDAGKVPVVSENGNYILQIFKAAKDGKSAYQYAVEGGYTGTEAEFAEKLAQEMLSGTTGELTPTQVYDAVSAGIPVKVQYTDNTYGVLSFTAFNVSESLNVIVSEILAYGNGVYMLCELVGDKSSNRWGFNITTLAQKTDIPTQLPNPNALQFTGSVTGSYDGSAPLEVEIPTVDDVLAALPTWEGGSY